MTFKASRRQNPFPGRQQLRFRRKLFTKVFRELDRIKKELKSPRTEVGGEENSRAESIIEVESSWSKVEPYVPRELDATTRIATHEAAFAESHEDALENPPCSQQESLGEKHMDPVLSCNVQSFEEVYFDDATGLIEVVGVPKPDDFPSDHMSDVRNQLEKMLAEWEHFSKSGSSCFDAL